VETTVNTYNWSFGDGGTSFLQNASHLYSSAGTYTVTLITTTDNGCTDTVTKTVTVYPQTTANYTINNAGQCLDGNSFTFTSTVIGSTVTNYNWTFGDGGTDTVANPLHTYTTAGTYNVKLVVTTDNGCKDSVIKTVTVYPQPAADFNINSQFQCLSGNNFIFSNTSTVSSGSMTYSWNFGDGGTSTLQNAQHSYSPGGIYNVGLITTTNFGCVDTIIKQVTVYPVIPATFTINGGAQCLNGNNFILANTDTTTSPTTTYVWTFGDGGTATTHNATHTYTTAGTYQVKLVKHELGCADSSIQTVTVYPQSNIGFNINNNSQCLAANSFIFTNATSIASGSISYQWSFGDGATSTIQNPQHSYTTPGIYNVRLIVTTNNGCIDSLIKAVEVYTQPGVDFTFNAGVQCLPGNSFVFINNSSVSATIVYQWFFGDGGTSSLPNPTHTYAVTGTYNVKLIVTTESSCTDSLTKQVTVINPSTMANAGTDQDLCNATSATLAANNPIAGEVTKWISVSGPSPVVFADSTAPNTVASNLQPGTYVLIWSITNGVCASSTDTVRIIIRPVITDSLAATTVTLCRGQSITVGGPRPTGGNGTYYYIWQQSTDGINWTTISGAIDSSYTFTPLDSIRIRRIVISGPCSSISSTVNILVQTPIVTNAISADHDICINTAPPLLIGSFPTGSDGAYYYQWQISINSGSTWTDIPGATAKDFQPGILSQNTMFRRIVKTLLCTGPEANISNIVSITMNITDGIMNYAGGFACNNVPVQFTVTPINGTEFTWNFGDGSPLVTTTSLTISHAYSNPGVYIPKVVIINPITGCTKTLTGFDTIKVDQVVADYSVQNFVTCNGTSTNFTNLSTAFFGLGTYSWDFGDGGTSNDQDPYHIYAGPGTYIVRLTTTGISGCIDTIAKEVIVNFYITPQPAIIAPDDICVKSNITYNVSLTPGDAIASYRWTFSNGLTSSNSSVTTSFNNVVPVLATVIIRTVNGCRDTATKLINVRPLPVVKANVDTTICFGNTKQLNVTGANAYQWDANNTLSCFSCTNPIATPSANALYIVTGTSQYGCIAKDSVYVNVVQPVHVLAARGDTICVGRTTRLSASGAAQYQWFPATGLNSTIVPNPVAQPTATTAYTVVGKDIFSCFTDTGHVQVVVGNPSGVYAGPDTLMESGMMLQISSTVINGPAFSYSWSPATNLSCSNCPNPIAAVKGDMTYILTITNQYGCRTSDTLRILTFCPDAQVFIPNILTPDGDGLNDYLIVRGKGVKVIKSFTIYNRWGQVVYQNENFVPNVRGKSWDGKFKGQLVDSDVFVYICEAVCEKGQSFLFKGNITVIK
jgi:gliding motility-associated-like protein